MPRFTPATNSRPYTAHQLRKAISVDPGSAVQHIFYGGDADDRDGLEPLGKMYNSAVREDFYWDPRLRVFARAFQVISLALDEPGTIRWAACDPFPAWHRPIAPRELLEMYHRLRLAIRARTMLLLLWQRKGERAIPKTVLETQLWNSQAEFAHEYAHLRDHHINSFITSCAVELRNQQLRFPLEPPETFVDKQYAAGLRELFAQGMSVARLVPDPDAFDLVKMDDSDDDGIAILDEMPAVAAGARRPIENDAEDHDGRSPRRSSASVSRLHASAEPTTSASRSRSSWSGADAED